MVDLTYDFGVKNSFKQRRHRWIHLRVCDAMVFPKGSRFILSILATAIWMWAAPQSSQAAPVTSFLHTQGQDIVNEQGEKILLRGVGLGNWMLPEGYMWKFGEQGTGPAKLKHLSVTWSGRKKRNSFGPDSEKIISPKPIFGSFQNSVIIPSVRRSTQVKTVSFRGRYAHRLRGGISLVG